MSNNIQSNKNIKIVAGIIIGIVLILLLLWVMRDRDEVTSSTNTSGYVVQSGSEPWTSQEELEAMLQAEVDKSIIAFNLQSTVKVDGRELDLVFANPEENAYDIDLQIVMDNHVIVQTEKVSPNQYIKGVTLTEDLSEGSYVVTGNVTGYDRQTGDEVPLRHQSAAEEKGELEGKVKGCC